LSEEKRLTYKQHQQNNYAANTARKTNLVYVLMALKTNDHNVHAVPEQLPATAWVQRPVWSNTLCWVM